MKVLVSFFISFIISLTVPLFFYTRIFAYNDKIVFISPIPERLSIDTDQDRINAARVNQAKTAISKPISILLLGVDGRKGDKNPRCDAIHTLKFDPEIGKITIYSVPRGTSVYLSDVTKESAYISNACHYLGIEKASNLIVKLTGVKPDFTVKVGFSQTMGILRNLNLPSVPSLQFLRSRKYAMGDYQRNFNQANFLKDAILNYLEKFYQLPNPVKYLAFKTLDTDISFEQAQAILDQIIQSGIYKNSDNILLQTKPAYPYKRKEIHLTSSLQSGVNWQLDSEFMDYQNNVKGYLDNLFKRSENYLTNNQLKNVYSVISTPFTQKLWLQLEDETDRNQYHLDLLYLYALSSPDKQSAASLLLDFITEMESTDKPDLKEQAQQILSGL